jgi:ABC-type bacteriocin/lantibiotic exporter with double-glycine peptidase domain
MESHVKNIPNIQRSQLIDLKLLRLLIEEQDKRNLDEIKGKDPIVLVGASGSGKSLATLWQAVR